MTWIIISLSLWCPRTLWNISFEDDTTKGMFQRNLEHISRHALHFKFALSFTMNLMLCFIIQNEPKQHSWRRCFDIQPLIIHNKQQQTIWGIQAEIEWETLSSSSSSSLALFRSMGDFRLTAGFCHSEPRITSHHMILLLIFHPILFFCWAQGWLTAACTLACPPKICDVKNKIK